ncbi:unnamed protein product, partial [Didymodactylos carnosus]
KKSQNCQSEANYARENKRYLIPLKIHTDYKPNGWLGLLVAGLNYIEFAGKEFNDAYDDLLEQIQLHRKAAKAVCPKSNRITTTVKSPRAVDQNLDHVIATVKSPITVDPKLNRTTTTVKSPTAVDPNLDHITTTVKSPITVDPKSNRTTTTVKSPRAVDQNLDHITTTKEPPSYSRRGIKSWTEKDVRDFLTDKHFEIMIPLCQNKDGSELYEMYKRYDKNILVTCKELNRQLERTHYEVLLPIDYNQFFSELQLYVPVTSPIPSSVCVIM